VSDLNDGLGFLAKGIEGFAQGMMDGEDRKYKRMEMEAKLEAQRQDKEREDAEREAKRAMDDFTRKDKEFDNRAKIISMGKKLPTLAEGQSVYDVPLESLETDYGYLSAKAMASATADPYGSKSRPTEGEFTASNFATRMQKANADLEKLIAGGFDPSSGKTALNEAIPDGRGLISRTAESFKDPKVKSYQQAKRNFVSAVLRKESGAAISIPEYIEEEKKYFPQPGDTPEVLQQKTETRAMAIQNMNAQGGRALGLMGQPAGMIPKGKIAKPKGSATVKPQTVIQNGHTYTLNPQTGQYE
jgi:hypothetical protein